VPPAKDDGETNPQIRKGRGKFSTAQVELLSIGSSNLSNIMLSNQYKERDLVLSNIMSNNNKNDGTIEKKQIEAFTASEQVPSLKKEQQRKDQGPNDMFKSVKTDGGEWMDATEEHLKNK
jgi:hypothetical protein